MSDNEQCRCPPKPSFAPGSLASGSATEEAAHARWEAQHGTHANARQGGNMQNPYEEMPAGHLRVEITRLSEALDTHLADARNELPADPDGAARDAFTARVCVANAQRIVEHLRYARSALAAKEDAEKVRNASAVLEMLKRTQGLVDGEAARLVAHARDYLRDVMGAK